MPTKNKPNEIPFTKEQISRWKERYDNELVDSYLEFFDLSALDKGADLLLNDLIEGKAFNRSFLAADLERRQSEAKMVAAEVRIFNATADLMEQSTDMRNQLRGTLNSETSVSALSALNEGIKSTADLVQALAEKNSTMGEGVPGGGTPTGPGGTAIPENGGGGGTITKPPCYEQYRRRIAELWDQKEQMGDSVMWWLQWADALKDLTLCAGPEAVKLLLELLSAAKK